MTGEIGLFNSPSRPLWQNEALATFLGGPPHGFPRTLCGGERGGRWLAPALFSKCGYVGYGRPSSGSLAQYQIRLPWNLGNPCAVRGLCENVWCCFVFDVLCCWLGCFAAVVIVVDNSQQLSQLVLRSHPVFVVSLRRYFGVSYIFTYCKYTWRALLKTT